MVLISKVTGHTRGNAMSETLVQPYCQDGTKW